jgi:hypothetical protein
MDDALDRLGRLDNGTTQLCDEMFALSVRLHSTSARAQLLHHEQQYQLVAQQVAVLQERTTAATQRTAAAELTGVPPLPLSPAAEWTVRAKASERAGHLSDAQACFKRAHTAATAAATANKEHAHGTPTPPHTNTATNTNNRTTTGSTEPTCSELLFELERVRRALASAAIQQAQLHYTTARREATSLSLAEFQDGYGVGSQPLVIAGLGVRCSCFGAQCLQLSCAPLDCIAIGDVCPSPSPPPLT